MRKIAFGYSTRCNIKCEHCVAAGESPQNQKMEFAKAKEIITALATAQVKGISFTAGEPLIYLADLLELIELCSELNIYTRVVTNSFWATDQKLASEVVTSLKAHGLCQLRLSYSRWHQKNIPRENINNAISACNQHKLAYFVSFVTDFSPEDEEYEQFLLDNNYKFFPEPLIHAGRATNLKPQELLTDYQDNCCAMNPDVAPNLDLFACCDAGSHFTKTNFFHLGNLQENTIEELLSKSETSTIYNQIRTMGITNIASFMGFKSREIVTMRKCDLCQKLFNSPTQLAAIQTKTQELANWHR